jgi:hypothetical protein
MSVTSACGCWTMICPNGCPLTVERARVLVAGEIVEKTPKGLDSMRALPLDDETALALDELRKRQMAEGIAAAPAHKASGYIVTDELGAPVHPEWYSDEFHRIAKRPWVRRIRLQESRHTALSPMEKAGVKTSIIAAWADHCSAAFTMATYVHANPEDLASGREALASVCIFVHCAAPAPAHPSTLPPLHLPYRPECGVSPRNVSTR